jgi:glucokinase
MGKKTYVGVDLGGTSMMAVAASEKGKVLGESDTATDRSSPEATIGQIIAQIEGALKDAKVKVSGIEAIGVGAPGAADPKTGVVAKAPNLGWTDVPLGAILSEHFNVPVAIGNDVQVAILGEHAFGAAKGAKRAVGIWVGTGIGGGLISDGELERGARGAAGEIGHMVLDENGPVCGCGRKGCAEAYASRTSMEREVMLRIAAGRSSVVPDVMKERQKTRMTSSVMKRALAANDEVMKEVVASAQHYLGLLAGNVVNMYDPEVIVIGGGVAQRLGEAFVGPIREKARSRFLRPDPDGRVKIVHAGLDDYSGALGAAVLARRNA